MRIAARVVVLALAALAAAALAVQAASTCKPGFYAFNQSGLIICLPPLEGAYNNSGVVMSFLYTGGVLTVNGSNTDAVEHAVTLEALSPTGDTLVLASWRVKPGSTFRRGLSLPSEPDYIVVNVSIDGVQGILYVVPRTEAERGLAPSSLGHPALAALAGLVPVAPLVAAATRGSLRDAGVGLVAYSFFITPWMIYWGMPVGSAVFLSGLVFVVGLFLALSGR